MRVFPGILCIAALAAACGAGSDHPLPAQPSEAGSGAILAAQLNGSWVEQGMVIGSSFRMNLASRDTAITGTGTYAIEAGRSGLLTVTGVVSGAMVHLDVVYDYGAQAQFDGTLSDQHTLKGTMHYGPPQSLTPSYLVLFLQTQG